MALVTSPAQHNADATHPASSLPSEHPLCVSIHLFKIGGGSAGAHGCRGLPSVSMKGDTPQMCCLRIWRAVHTALYLAQSQCHSREAVTAWESQIHL